MGALIGITLISGCVGDPITQITAAPLTLTDVAFLNAYPAASIVAVGGTQQLSATGITYTGEPVTQFDSVVYQYNSLSDTLRFKLSPSGLVTGVGTSGTTLMRVNVIAFKGSTIRGDQIIVQVTPATITGLTMSIQPVAPDSAKLAMGTRKTIVPVVRNPSTGESVANPAVIYEVRGSDSSRVDVFRGNVTYRINPSDLMIVRPGTSASVGTNQILALRGEGSARIYATIVAYGTALKDSVQYTFSYPYSQTISTQKLNLAVVNAFADQTVILAPGATLTFSNNVSSTDALTVTYTFDNPAAATAANPASTTGGASGDVTVLTGGQSSRRRFDTPGTYKWTAVTGGGQAPWTGQTLSGTIVIK